MRSFRTQLSGHFFFVTDKQQRRRGYATQLISAMADWGKANGGREANPFEAKKVYLQVETDNQAGINLYNKLGFTEVYQYFYRFQP
ncbi:MAG: GNAT family N-acetyltransferase [Cyanobacteria bacterium J06600_6]